MSSRNLAEMEAKKGHLNEIGEAANIHNGPLGPQWGDDGHHSHEAESGHTRQGPGGEVDLRAGSGRSIEDIETEEDEYAEEESADEESEEESDEESEASIEKSEELRCVKWYFKQRDDGSGYRNKTFELDLHEPAGCGCALCDIVARLAMWFIRLVDPNAHLGDAVELEFIPISNLRFGWLNGIVDIRLYTEVSTTHTEPYQFSGLTSPSIVWASNLAACRWVYRAQVVILP